MKKILFLTILLLLTPKSASAQGLNLSLSPPLLKATIKPGRAISQVFTIYNNSSDPIKLTPRIVPFLPEDDQGNPSLKTQSKPAWLAYFSLANSKISLNQPFTLLANQSDQLVLVIKIPEDATTVDHYATLLVNSEGSTSKDFTSIAGSIGANILLTIANQAAPPTILNITDLKPTGVKFIKIGQTYLLDNLTPIKFSARLENLGQHLAEAHGLLQINQKSEVVHIQPILPINVLKQSTRQITASPSGQLKFTPKITQLGLYQANLNIRSENGSSQNSIKLFLLPIKAGFGATIAFLLLNLILKKTKT